MIHKMGLLTITGGEGGGRICAAVYGIQNNEDWKMQFVVFKSPSRNFHFHYIVSHNLLSTTQLFLESSFLGGLLL